LRKGQVGHTEAVSATKRSFRELERSSNEGKATLSFLFLLDPNEKNGYKRHNAVLTRQSTTHIIRQRDIQIFRPLSQSRTRQVSILIQLLLLRRDLVEDHSERFPAFHEPRV
jgi:hypothetical protein